MMENSLYDTFRNGICELSENPSQYIKSAFYDLLNDEWDTLAVFGGSLALSADLKHGMNLSDLVLGGALIAGLMKGFSVSSARGISNLLYCVPGAVVGLNLHSNSGSPPFIGGVPLLIFFADYIRKNNYDPDAGDLTQDSNLGSSYIPSDQQ